MQPDPLKALEVSFEQLRLAKIPIMFSSEETKKESPNQVEYAMVNGRAFSHNIINIEAISIARTQVLLTDKTKKALWLRHHHKEKELLIPISGKATLYVCDLKVNLKLGRCDPGSCEPEKCIDARRYNFIPGETMILEPESIHSAVFEEDSTFIALTLPGSPEWPGSIKD